MTPAQRAQFDQIFHTGRRPAPDSAAAAVTAWCRMGAHRNYCHPKANCTCVCHRPEAEELFARRVEEIVAATTIGWLKEHHPNGCGQADCPRHGDGGFYTRVGERCVYREFTKAFEVVRRAAAEGAVPP